MFATFFILMPSLSASTGPFIQAFMEIFGLAFLCLVRNYSDSSISYDWWVVELGDKKVTSQNFP